MPYNVPYSQLSEAQKQRLRDNARAWNIKNRELIRARQAAKKPNSASATKIDWGLHEKEIIARYLAGASTGDLAKDFPFKRTAIKEFLKRRGLLRDGSSAQSLAAKQGKKQKSTDVIIRLNREDPRIRFNPAKTPWKGNPELNPNWIKDRTKLKYPRSRTELRAWRRAVFERDNYTCQICNKRGGRLQADHIKAYARFPELRTDLNNGRTLCEPCHRKTPNYGAKAMKVL